MRSMKAKKALADMNITRPIMGEPGAKGGRRRGKGRMEGRRKGGGT